MMSINIHGDCEGRGGMKKAFFYGMRSRLFLWILGACIFALAACTKQLSRQEIELLDAMIFGLEGVEDTDQQKHRLYPWKREVIGREVYFWTIGRNSYGFSDDEMNKKTKDSRFV